jgi:hypothetical protein
MQFVKFGDEYVAASKIVRVVFRTVRETAASSSPDPFKHEPQAKDNVVAVAEVTIQGKKSELQVRGDAALEALRRFCEHESVAIF